MARRGAGRGLGYSQYRILSALPRHLRPAGRAAQQRTLGARWAQRDYGNRVGIWRLMDVLNKHGIRASPTLNSDICDHHPQIVRAAIDLGWEILGHNRTNSVWLDQLGPEEERQTIAHTLSRIAEMIGKKTGRLARRWPCRDLAYPRLPRRGGVSLCRRLGQR